MPKRQTFTMSVDVFAHARSDGVGKMFCQKTISMALMCHVNCFSNPVVAQFCSKQTLTVLAW